jgi:hypothetical protein
MSIFNLIYFKINSLFPGNVQSHNHNGLRAVGELVKENVGKVIEVDVLRSDGLEESILSLSLTPQPWDGPGLLGCHLALLS